MKENKFVLPLEIRNIILQHSRLDLNLTDDALLKPLFIP